MMLNLLICFTALMEAWSMFMLFTVFMKPRFWGVKQTFIVGVLVLMGVISLYGMSATYPFANDFFTILIGGIIGCVFYSGGFIVAFLVSAAVNVTSLTLMIVILKGILACLQLNIEAITEIGIYQLSGVIMAKSILLLVSYIIYRYKRKKGSRIVKTYWRSLVLLLGITLLAIIILFELSAEVMCVKHTGETLVCMIGMFVYMIFTLLLYDRQVQQAEELYLQAQVELRLQEQLKHMDELIAQQEMMRRFRHDISNQLVVIQKYLENGNKEKELKHIDSLVESLDKAEQVLDTGNLALDAIISTKQALAENKGIHFEYQLQIPENLPMAPEDVCVIFGNALDNAIEACERIQNGNKSIRCVLIELHNCLFCKIVNTAPCRQDERWITSKKDKVNHGYGVSQIRHALEKYDCEPEFNWENDTFTLKFVILNQVTIK